MPPIPTVTRNLMLLCTAVFCLQSLLPMVSNWGAMWPLGSGRLMPWQLISHAFLHVNFVHLLFNMLGLWSFGAELERLWGPKRYMQYLLASTVVAALTHLVVSMLLGNGAPTMGASGAVFGLLMAFGMLFPERTIMLLIPPIPMKAKTYVMVFGAIELVFGLSRTGGNVAHFAHLGGLLGGWLMLRYWRGQPPFGGGGQRRR